MTPNTQAELLALAEREARQLGERAGVDSFDGFDVFVADAAETLIRFCALAATDGAEAVAVFSQMEAVLEELAASRPHAAYLAMVDAGQSEALLKLDDLRRAARRLLAGPSAPEVKAEAFSPEIEELIERLLDAQQDINLAANSTMDQSLCDASALIDEVETVLRRFTAPPAPSQEISAAGRDVLAERRRQVKVEGWTPEHDDRHNHDEMALAAICYAMPNKSSWDSDIIRRLWPWSHDWLKRGEKRRNLVKAAALIVAEIERLDRAPPSRN